MENINELGEVVALIAGLSIVIGLMYKILSYASVNIISIVPVIQNIIAYTIYITILTVYKVINTQRELGSRLDITIMLVYFLTVLFAGNRIAETITEKKEVVKDKHGYKTAERLEFLKVYNITVFITYGIFLLTKLNNQCLSDNIRIFLSKKNISNGEGLIYIYSIVSICMMAIFLNRENSKMDTNNTNIEHKEKSKNKIERKYLNNEVQRAIRKNR